jgi:hypothetical protein
VNPSLLHVSHPKSGSTWITDISARSGAVREVFKQRFAETLIATGYEADDSW